MADSDGNLSQSVANLGLISLILRKSDRPGGLEVRPAWALAWPGGAGVPLVGPVRPATRGGSAFPW
jgi:hypothetical protein